MSTLTKEKQIEQYKKEMITRRNVLMAIPKIIDNFSNENDKDHFIKICKKVNPQVIAEIGHYGKQLMMLGLSKEDVVDILVVKAQ